MAKANTSGGALESINHKTSKRRGSATVPRGSMFSNRLSEERFSANWTGIPNRTATRAFAASRQVAASKTGITQEKMTMMKSRRAPFSSTVTDQPDHQIEQHIHNRQNYLPENVEVKSEPVCNERQDEQQRDQNQKSKSLETCQRER